MRSDREAASRLSRSLKSAVPVAVAAVTIGILVSCASVKSPPGTQTARFVQNPDRVWDGIEVTLDALGYEMATSNRDEGVIHAISRGEEPSPSVALEISQIVYTDDQVDVFVRGVAADPAVAPQQETLDRAAADFITVLRRKLGY